MLKNRHLLPLIAGIVLLALAGYAGIRRATTVVASSQSVLTPGGNALEFTNLDLKSDLHYRLAFGSLRALPLNSSAVSSASVADEYGTLVFELDDSYWHETGTWHEEGESGTWDETNAVTAFDFRVPADGKYDVDIGVEQATSGSVPVGGQLLSSSPAPFAEWPLLIVACLLFVLAGWVWFKRGDKMAEWVATLGTGSRLRVGGEEWTVTRWASYESYGETSIELTLTSASGLVRFLSETRWEKEWEDSEGEDHTKYYRQILLGAPPEPGELKANNGHVIYRDAWYELDQDNSGVEKYTEYRELGVATASYRSEVYRPSIFPTRPGEIWIENSRDQRSGEEEWTIHRIVDWKEISIIDEKPQNKPQVEA